MRTFQATLDDINVLLSAAEIHALQNLLGRTDRDDDRIDYVRFCRLLENAQYRPLGNKGRRELAPPAPYLSYKVIDRFLELKREGRNPIDLFEVYDLDRTGMVKFFRIFIFCVLKLILYRCLISLDRCSSI
jgi:hypothetical protein